MSRDFLVQIRPDTPNPLRLVVDFSPQAQQNFNRNHPGINSADIDLLRSGQATAVAKNTVETTVTDWFLSNDLRPLLGPALMSPVRIVITTDHKLESTFANMPFELTKWDLNDYLVRLGNVTGLVYAPATSPFVGAPAPQTTTFRVLLIRAQPNNHAGTIPSGTALWNALKAIVPVTPNVTVEVRLLSNEPGADGLPTWKSIQDEIKARPPSALLYLGHGDILPGAEGVPASPVLLLERDDGEQDDIPAEKLRSVLRKTPVPMVALAGCLTAAAANNPSTTRFTQSMAQYLVAGEGGVTVAIGMRFKIDVLAASKFLEDLFASLFGTETGHVDLAVKAARDSLFNNFKDLSWAAPMVFRRVTSEPLFPELKRTTPAPVPVAANPITADDEAAREQLSAIWTSLAGLPADPPPSLLDTFHQLLDTIDTVLRKRLTDRAAVALVPTIDQLVVSPGTTCKVIVELSDAVDVQEVKFDLAIRGSGTWGKHTLTQAAKDAGYKRFVNDDDPRMICVEVRTDKASTLPRGALYEAELVVGADAPSVVEVSIIDVTSDLPQAVSLGWVTAVVVRPS